MKFNEIVYKRPDFDGLIKEISGYLDELETARSEEDFFASHKKINDSFLLVEELYNIVSIRI